MIDQINNRIDTPKVSIITPSFNRDKLIKETAQSVFQQTYENWEWIIVDDGSTDQTWEVINEFSAKDDRVKIFKREREPKGASTCRNIAVENCRGGFLIFLDTDDLLAPFCLQQRVNAIVIKPELDFVVFPMLMFKNKPDDLQVLWNINTDEDDIERILYGDPVCQGTGTIWNKKSFVEIGMWDEQLNLWQDIELHLRSLLSGLKYSKRFDLEPDVFIRISEGSLSRKGYHSFPKFISRFCILKQVTEKIKNIGIMYKYKNAIKYMFIGIYINAVKSRFHSKVKEMLLFQANYNLFTYMELNKLRLFAFAYKIRAYSLPFMSNYLYKLLVKEKESPNYRIGKVVYNK